MSPLIYFHASETAKGRRDYLSSQLQGIEHIVEINEPTRYEESRMLEDILKTWEKETADKQALECLLDPLNPRLKVAIINREKKSACVTPVRLIDETLRESYYQTLNKALLLHDDLEKIYINATDFERLNHYTESFLSTHIPTDLNIDQTSTIYHRFLGSTTAYGTIDFINKLTETVTKRYYIKGRAGSGKSTFLKKVASRAKKAGYDTELYHCGFDPDSLDMVIIRKLNLAIFDSTLPHEHNPSREGDETIELYGTFIDEKTDFSYQESISQLNNQIHDEMKQAIKILQQDEQIKKQNEDVLNNEVLAFNQRVRHYLTLLEQ